MLISIKVSANAKHPCVVPGDPWIVKVRAKAIGGAANKAVVSALAKHCRVAQSRITILQGHHSPRKIVEINSC